MRRLAASALLAVLCIAAIYLIVDNNSEVLREQDSAVSPRDGQYLTSRGEAAEHDPLAAGKLRKAKMARKIAAQVQAMKHAMQNEALMRSTMVQDREMAMHAVAAMQRQRSAVRERQMRPSMRASPQLASPVPRTEARAHVRAMQPSAEAQAIAAARQSLARTSTRMIQIRQQRDARSISDTRSEARDTTDPVDAGSNWGFDANDAAAAKGTAAPESLHAQLTAEHQRLLQERAKVSQVQREAFAAIQAVKEQAEHEAHVALASMQQQAIQLAAHIAHSEAKQVVSDATEDSDAAAHQLAAPGTKNQALTLTATTEKANEQAQSLQLAQTAMQQARQAREAETRLQRRLKQALQQQQSLKAMQQQQQQRITSLVAQARRSSGALEGVQQQVQEEIPAQRLQHSQLEQAEAQRSAAVAEARALKAELAAERARRVEAERLAAGVAAPTPSTTQDTREGQQGSEAAKLSAATSTARAAVSAMRHAAKLAQSARS